MDLVVQKNSDHIDPKMEKAKHIIMIHDSTGKVSTCVLFLKINKQKIDAFFFFGFGPLLLGAFLVRPKRPPCLPPW